MKFATILWISVLCFQAQARIFGGDGSGGGVAYVWRDASTGRIVKAELIDLYMYKHDSAYSFQYQDINEPEATQTAKIKSLSKGIVQNALALVERDFTFLDKGVKIPLSPEYVSNEYSGTTPQLGPDAAVCQQQGQTCGPEMVAYYDSRGKLQVNPEIYQALSETNKMAFRLHEAVYKFQRVYGGDTTADNTRLIVAAEVHLATAPDHTQSEQWIWSLISSKSADDAKTFRAPPDQDPQRTNKDLRQQLDIQMADLILAGRVLSCESLHPTANEKPVLFSTGADKDFLGPGVMRLLVGGRDPGGGNHLSRFWTAENPFSDKSILSPFDVSGYLEISLFDHYGGTNFKIYGEDLMVSAKKIRAHASDKYYECEGPSDEVCTYHQKETDMVCHF